MNRTIWKYELLPSEVTYLRMPDGARPLCVQVQKGKVCLWAEVDQGLTDGPTTVIRTFFVIGTGHRVPREAKTYIGTFQLNDGDLVFHVYSGEL